MSGVAGPEMSGTRLIVPDITGTPSGYGITTTVGSDGGHLPDPAEFAKAAERAASAQAASVVSGHG